MTDPQGRNAEGSESQVAPDLLPDEERSGPSASPDWKRLALHALHDLRLLGVPIESIVGVNETVLSQVDCYDQEMTTFS
jgi:hypothetical protein